jgi:hypothetical protein
MKLTSVDVALIAVFAALQALLAVVPFTPTIGAAGYEITLGVIGGSLIGILLGPIIGGFAVLIGSLVGLFLNPAGAFLGVLTVIPPFSGAFAAGCVKIKRGYVAGVVILASVLAFYANPIGREVFEYNWLHIIAMIVAFSPIAYFAGSTFSSRQLLKPTLGIVVASFVGVLTDHAVGDALTIWYLSPSIPPATWLLVMFIYPVERFIALILTSIVALPVYSGLKRAGMIDLRNKI